MSDDLTPDELIQGLLYAHTRSNLNTIEVHRALAAVLALVDVLADRGIVERADFEQRRDEVAQTLRQQFVENGMAVAINEQATSKYEYREAVAIDCASRVSLCKASCCRLSFALSKEDVEEGIVRWDLGRPYIIAQGPGGNCSHLGIDSKSCGVYEQRPLTCRKFDCRQDKRIWQDFEQRIPNPRIGESDWLRAEAEG